MFEEITNEHRAAWAQDALEFFQSAIETDDCDAVADLLCNLMHLCNQDAGIWGSFEANIRRAVFNYEAEIQAEADAIGEGLADAT